jgi:elongation factor P--(R)-beta-lysine ligase
MSGQAWWDPERFAGRRRQLETRTAVARAVRTYFAAEDFLEVETPALQVSPGLEPHLHAFRTELRDPHGGPPRTRYLRTSPEFTLKKLLVAGLPRVFELAPSYRNAERSSTHSPEFTMLEWYRAGETYAALERDCAGLLRAAGDAAGADRLRWRGQECDPRAPAERLIVADAFVKHAGVTLDELRRGGREAFEDRFFRLFLEAVEPKLGIGRATLLVDWPIELAALARAKPGDPTLCERVELFVCGLELANGWSELTDPVEQRARFERDVAEKARLYGERYPIDPDFMAALEHGLPASAGMALGFDRLVMCATGAEHIDDVRFAPVDAETE